MALIFVLAALAAYRVTQLVIADSIVHTWRERWFDRFPTRAYIDPETKKVVEAHPLGQLVECPWCIGFWISGAVFGIVWSVHSVPMPALWWPAISSVVGVLGTMKGED